ncbi:MAG: glycosyltransferase involved in cell wall biosynthesis [Desulforhopalus sp.]|jgi:glycosyltransferase involved in cell wall biosynthesis
MIRLCIWMNIPSHHQSAFFDALEKRNDVDLKVIYLEISAKNRVKEGWHDAHDFRPFESNADGLPLISGMADLLPDWAERIHLTSSYFTSELIDLFCENQVSWCHWSEMPGIRLAELLRYQMLLFRLLNPLMLFYKRREGRSIRKHALGAFCQGQLAQNAFRCMGVPEENISPLYYVPDALQPMVACNQIIKFAAGRKVFLTVGALCPRKGIDILLKAFAQLETSEWCLVLCGLDKLDGCYQALSKKLGIADHVLFLGAYPSDRIAEIYSAANIFILPSRFDGWGAVLNEAASLGMPLIATDMCGAAWHVVEDDKNGFRIKVGSISDLAEKMRVYITQPHLIKDHGKYSKELFSREFTPERNVERLIQGIAAFTRGRSIR